MTGDYFLRRYTSIARQSHFCIYCMRYIEPGERYNADVWAYSGRGIAVFKQHADGCEPDPSDEDFLNAHNTIERTLEQAEILELAA